MTARARSLLTTPPARAWSQGRDVLGPELLPQPETGLPAPGTPHAPLPASVSLPCTRARRTRVVTRATPRFRQAAFPPFPDSRTLPAPWLPQWVRATGAPTPCIVPPAAPVAAVLAGRERRWETRQGAEPRGGSFLLARTAASSPALAPCTRAPPLAAPRPQGSESFAFHLGETKRGSAMGQGGQGPKGKTGRALTRPWK